MSAFRPRNQLVALLAALTSAITLLPANQAFAATFNNACVNNVKPELSALIPVTMTANPSPNPVGPGKSVTLSGIHQELAVPSAVFLNGYNLGLLKEGLNQIPVELSTSIIGRNTVEGEQVATATGEAETTITGPKGSATATPGQVSITYPNQTWTAKEASPITFREKTVQPLGYPRLSGEEGGPTPAGIKVVASVGGGVIKVAFDCSPGKVVEEANPSTIAYEEGATFASVQVKGSNTGPNNAPNTKLKSVKIKGHKATFKFSSDENGSTFLCKLDKKKFAKCKSPKTYKNLKPGKHKFQVKARDKEGNLDPTPAVKKFTIRK